MSLQSDGEPLAFIPILSIDGGGVKGLIAAVILNYLESELKRLDIEGGGDGEDARIANYFYTIAGTSTGGLITMMLTCPNEKGRPLFTAEEIVEFYMEQSPKIFPQSSVCIWGLPDFIRCLRGPKYDGKHLHGLMRELLGKKRLSDTLTNVVIVTWNIKLSERVIFSSHELRNSARQDAFLFDIGISTSAAPIFLPSHYFQTTSPSITKFDLVDGGVIANNPIVPAIKETVKEVTGGTEDMADAVRHGEFLILSIGTGTKFQEGYSARDSAKWNLLKWLYNKGNSPILNMVGGGSDAMIDEGLPMFIATLKAPYLRIEAKNLDGDMSSLDLATNQNLNNLMRVGKELLDEPVCLEMGLSEAYSGLTNGQALTRIAETLHRQKGRLRTRNLRIGKELLPNLLSSRDIEIEPGFRYVNR